MTTTEHLRGVENSSAPPGGRTAPRVNVAVSGVFHFRQYVRSLSEAGVLNRFYYSHRRSTTAKTLGLTSPQAVNLWPKEYLTHAHLRLINHRLGNLLFPLYQDIFDRGVVRHWSDCDVLHTMLHGASRKTIEHARRNGSVVVGEPVNCHPAFVQRLLREEHERLGIPAANVSTLNRGQAQTLEEAARCNHLVVASRFLARSYVEQGFDAESITVIPYGADLSRFTRKARADDSIFRVVSVGQVSPRKGHVDLIGAWKSLGLVDSELIFAGSMTPEMESVLAPDRSRFRFLGHVPHDHLPEFYSQADVAVCPSIEDGFSLVPLEAMACGVPVIISENAGASELIEHGVTGFVVPARSPEAIGEALETLYRDPQRRRAMGESAAMTVHQSHGWQRYAERLATMYRKAMSSS